MPWSIVAANHRVLALSRATTRTVSVLSIWVLRMHARRFMGRQNVNFARTSVSKTSALVLRFLKGSHPFFLVVPRSPLRPSVNPRPGVRMWSSRRWRTNRRFSPVLSLSHLSTCARVHWLNSRTIIYILARHGFLRARGCVIYSSLQL